MLSLTSFYFRRLHRLTGSAVGHSFIPADVESRLSYARSVFHLSLLFITFGARSAQLAHHVHKSSLGTKSSLIASRSVLDHKINWLHLTVVSGITINTDSVGQSWKIDIFQCEYISFPFHDRLSNLLLSLYYTILAAKTPRSRFSLICVSSLSFEFLIEGSTSNFTINIDNL